MTYYAPSWDSLLYAFDEDYRKEAGEEYLKRAAFNDPCNLIIGAEGKAFEGWTPTDVAYFDVTSSEDWHKYFKPNVVDAVMAEHVFEHIEVELACEAFALIYKFLKVGGSFLISVPDGEHPDPAYIDQVKPGGTGDGADDHKVLYDLSFLREKLESASYRVTPLEYWDYTELNTPFLHSSIGGQHYLENLTRTFAKDPRNRSGTVSYTSLILLATKD